MDAGEKESRAFVGMVDDNIPKGLDERVLERDIELENIIDRGVLPSPLKLVEEPLDESNENLPGKLVISKSGELLKKYITFEGFGNHHIEVFDNWISNYARGNVESLYLEFKGNTVCFDRLNILPPRYTRDGKVLDLTPKMAREQGVTYGSDWHVDIVLKEGDFNGREIERIQGVCIGNVPTMLKSAKCILRGKTQKELALLGEDPHDPGGYLIISGVEKVVLLQEQLALNKIFLMNMGSKDPPVIRMITNTMKGTVLVELGLDKEGTGNLEIRLPSIRVANEKGNDNDTIKYQTINVLRIFRLFGVSDSVQIQSIIALFMKPEHVKLSMLKLTRTLCDFEVEKDDMKILIQKLDDSKINEPSKNNASNKPPMTKEDKIKQIFGFLTKDLFPHVNNLQGPDGETIQERESRITNAKLYLLAIMIARYLEHLAGFRALDDRDSWSNKKVEGAGRMMEQLFRKAWRKTLGILAAGIAVKSFKNLNDIAEKLRTNIITDTFHDSFITSHWGIKGSQTKDNVSQTLVRDSVVATFAHINTVDVGMRRDNRHEELRRVQNTQWGFIDPASTPEGENAGIVKNLSLTARVSLERSDEIIIRDLIGDAEKGLPSFVTFNVGDIVGNIINGFEKKGLSPMQTYEKWTDKIIVNGKFLGWCDGDTTCEFLINRRRQFNGFPADMSVIKDDDWVYVDISPSRLIRPLLIVDPDQQLAIDRLNLRGQSPKILLGNGVMEYISSWEQEYIKVATSVDVIKKRLKLIQDTNNALTVARRQLLDVERGAQIEPNGKNFMTVEDAKERVESAQNASDKLKNNRPYTHCELDPLAILGIAASLIPWPNHNQAPRNTYQISMGKQALGVYHSNHENRFDGKTKLLVFPNRPMVETEMYDVIGLNDRGPGENITMAFMAFPYTEEDSFMVKKEFLDNGGFRMVKYITYKTVVKHDDNVIEKLMKPELRLGEPPGRYDYIYNAEPGNQMNGLPMIGAPLNQGDCVIGKLQSIPSVKEPRNESVWLRVGDTGVVEKVLVTSDIKNTTVNVKLRIMRVLQEGDKVAPRNAQKCTAGLVVRDIDMPFTDRGIVPDVIVNPHCFVASTPILLKNGTCKPLISMQYNGGDAVWSWNTKSCDFVTSTTLGYESQGDQDVYRLTFSDGRTIKCTSNHKFPVMEQTCGLNIHRMVEAKDIKPDMLLFASMDGVLDIPSLDEFGWNLNTQHYNFNMLTETERNKSLAFARLVGLICTDGCLSQNKSNKISGNIVVGSNIDADLVLDDIELITKKRPSITKHYSSQGGSTLGIGLPAEFARSVGFLEGMNIGRRSSQIQTWPSFLLNDDCPKSLIREFLGGVFGGDGWCPYLTTNNQDGQGTVTFNPPALSQSSNLEFADHLVQKLQDIINLLEKIDVPGSRMEKLKGYNKISEDGSQNNMVTCIIQLPRGTDFGDKVGFRYCVQKMHRMAAFQSYMRYLSNVKRQNDFIVKRSSEIYDSGAVGRSMQNALIAARKELFSKESPLNEYYSNATLDQVKNRRRKDRHDEVLKWDYTKIEDADKYLRKIGAYHWFRTSEDKAGADYIIKQDGSSLPYFTLTLNEIRFIGKEEVFDIGVDKTHTVTVSGLSASNSIPSRMTLEYIMELHAAKHGAMKGVHINAGAFQPYFMNIYKETLRKYMMNEYGYETMRSGTSGKPLEYLIYSGPMFFQVLKHHVIDKVQARPTTGSVKPMTRQPPKGKFLSTFADTISANC